MADVYESDISKVSEGASVRISTLAYPDKMFAGTIDKVYHLLTLCNLLGCDVENGEIPLSEMERVCQMVEDISYFNAKNFFHF